ncbi:MAG: SipW-dependent-type signal peptide-containing protein [Parcubacteria group bacterium]
MKNIIKSLVIVVAVAAVASVATWAVFSDTDSVTGNTVATGTLNLTVNESAGKPFSISGAYPGYVSGWEYIDIYNQGSLPFEAQMSFNQTSGSGALYNELTIELVTSGGDSICANGGFGETTIYSGKIINYDPTTVVSSIAYWHNANETDGSGPNDNIRAGWSERVCQRVGVDSGAGNGIQGTSVTFDEIVDALQDND